MMSQRSGQQTGRVHNAIAQWICAARPTQNLEGNDNAVTVLIALCCMAFRHLIDNPSWRSPPGEQSDPPKALESEYPLKQIIRAAVVQGAIFSAVKTIIDRQGARLFEKADR
jgi:Protein of unknown function (DUF4235)